MSRRSILGSGRQSGTNCADFAVGTNSCVRREISFQKIAHRRRHRSEPDGRRLVRSERRDTVGVFQFMTANRAEYSVETMARSMGVSRSGFYAWQTREPSARDIADRELTNLIRQIHAASRESYGAPRIHAELADSGVHGRKGLSGLYVSKEEVLDALEGPPLDRFTKELRWKWRVSTSTITHLVNSGFVRSHRTRHPRNRKHLDLVDPDEVHRFEQQHRTLGCLSVECALHPIGLASKLADLNVRSINLPKSLSRIYRLLFLMTPKYVRPG